MPRWFGHAPIVPRHDAGCRRPVPPPVIRGAITSFHDGARPLRRPSGRAPEMWWECAVVDQPGLGGWSTSWAR
ncbi:hypothetical protein ACFPM0_07235 [Pseudonocardia sulfidoxydans]|uniref:hypothetical protein n=1 Tax=Pseudonocardia sulfidoxydans TaxID=54011 RepID=UPI003616284B